MTGGNVNNVSFGSILIILHEMYMIIVIGISKPKLAISDSAQQKELIN